MGLQVAGAIIVAAVLAALFLLWIDDVPRM